MRSVVGAVIAVVVAAALGIGLVTLLATRALALPTITAASSSAPPYAGLKRATLTIETFPNDPYEDPDWIAKNVTGKTLDGEPYPQEIGDNPDWVKYWPTSNLVVPAHTLVTITLMNFDGATPLLNDFYATPQGTVDPSTGDTNVMYVDGKEAQSADPANVSHTFTIHSIPNANQPWLYVSVPVTAVPDSAPTDDFGMPNAPVVTTFSFVTGAPGQYIWQCFDPCGSGFNGFSGPMSTKGYMSGTFTVQ